MLCVEDTMEMACVCAQTGVWTGLKRHYHGEALARSEHDDAIAIRVYVLSADAINLA